MAPVHKGGESSFLSSFCSGPESRIWSEPLNRFLFPQIEGLMDDVDFKAKVTRGEFEELCADLFERVPGPVQQALQSAEMSLVRACARQACLPECRRCPPGVRERPVLRKGVNSCISPSPSAG